MNLYVYRINDHEYGAGLGLAECQKRGTIVEQWPLNSPADARFLATHGSNYQGVSVKVSKIADLMYELMMLDPTHRPEPEYKPLLKWELVEEIEPQPKPTFMQRFFPWFYAR